MDYGFWLKKGVGLVIFALFAMKMAKPKFKS